MNKNLKYLQNIFLLLMMGFSLCAVQACSDDDEDRVLDNGNLLISGHEAVDLGLSVKWATCNVGASLPEDYGGYFAWGETVGYTKDQVGVDKIFNTQNYGENLFDKYAQGKLSVLQSEDDAATVNMGAEYRMPTKDDINELVNALKPTVIAGDELTIELSKLGKDPTQGVGYLDDGTMVVVENGADYVDKNVEIVVTSMLQTNAGKIIFAKVK